MLMYEVIYEYNKLILCQHGATEASLCDFIPRKRIARALLLLLGLSSFMIRYVSRLV